MSALPAPLRPSPPASLPPGSAPAPPARVDNRLAYAFFAVAYIFGHGASALVLGAGLEVPSWVPLAILGAAFAAGTVASTVSAVRAQRTLSGGELVSARLLGMAWVTGFAGLTLVILGLTQSTGDASLQLLLWPTGSALVVGLIYVAEGAMRRDTLHYALGTLLTVLGGVALLLPAPATLTLMAVVGGAAYVGAVVFAHARGRTT